MKETRMNVRISYSIKIDELQAEVARILKMRATCAIEVEKLYRNLIDGASGSSSPALQLNRIEEIREKLFLLDQRLADCVNLYTGYLEALQDPVPKEPDDS